MELKRIRKHLNKLWNENGRKFTWDIMERTKDGYLIWVRDGDHYCYRFWSSDIKNVHDIDKKLGLNDQLKGEAKKND